MLYNFKGAQIHTNNPMIAHHYFYEAGAKELTLEHVQERNALIKKAQDEFDRYVCFQNSLERALIAGEDQPEYFWPLHLRRAKNCHTCYYDYSMQWAGLTDKKFMGKTGDVFFTEEEDAHVLKYLDQFKDNFIVLWGIRGSMYQKAIFPIAEEICNEFIKMHPEAIIIATGDKFCQEWEWEHPKVIHRSGRMPFRQALHISKYADLVVTPETGLGIGAGSFDTPKIMLLTAASLKNIVGNDMNDYSIQSPVWCSPCTRAIYNTDNCELGPEKQYLKGKVIDQCAYNYGKATLTRLPICVDFPKELVLDQMEKAYNAKHKRAWDRPDGWTETNWRMPERDISKIKPVWAKRKQPKSAVEDGGIKALVKTAKDAPPGDIVEIGVYRGGSAWYLDEICHDQGRTLHLFDTFEGMPFRSMYDSIPVGYFSDIIYDEITALFPDAKFYKGIFPDTLPDDLHNIAFVHVDCDQYYSVKSVIRSMPDRMVKGGIMYFDDYENIRGAKIAIDECLKDFTVFDKGRRVIWTKS